MWQRIKGPTEANVESACHDLVIVGGGPAGLTAGMYAARSRLDVVLLEGKACGGQLMTYESVENYPGFPEGIEAPELVQRMVDQATRFGLKIVKDKALSVEIHPDKPEKTIVLQAGTIRCKSIIVATGAHARKIGVEGEDRLTGRRGMPTAIEASGSGPQDDRSGDTVRLEDRKRQGAVRRGTSGKI